VPERAADAVAWTPGQRLVTRGQAWTLLHAEQGVDCTGLRLTSELDANIRTLLSPFDRFHPSAVSPKPAVVRIRRWIHFVRRLAACSQPAGALKAAAGANMRLLPFQLEPALAVVRYGATRVLIADAVGLGKTIQAGLIVADQFERAPSVRVLILAPAGLREQWRAELARVFMLSSIAADSAWLRAATTERPTGTNPWALPGIYVASHDFVKRPEVLRPLEDVTWDLLVVDEAHAASSRSDRRAAVDAVARRSRRIVLLTATPHLDSAAEYEALCAIGSLDRTGESILVFRRSREEVSAGPGRRSTLLAVRPSAAEQRMHQLLDEYTHRVWQESTQRGDELARLAAIVLRKRALSSAGSLAASIRRRMELLVGSGARIEEQLLLPIIDEEPLEDEMPRAALGAPGLADAARERRWLSLIAEAAQHAACDESKTRFIRRLLARIHEPAIVFTEYRDTLVRLRDALAGSNRTLLLLHGGMSLSERIRVQREFNESPAVLLATDAAAEGLNLHAQCRLVIHYELPWSVSRLEQRAGRVDRFGQSRRVHETALVADSTAERLVLAPLLRRAFQAASLDRMSGLAGMLTESNVAHILLGDTAPKPAGVALDQAAHRSRPGWAAHLGDASRREVQRLSEIRAYIERSPQQAGVSHPQRPMAAAIEARSSGLRCGLALIYMLSISWRVRRFVHEQPLVITIPHSCDGGSSARTIRDVVFPFCNPAHPEVRAVVDRAVREALDTVFPIHERLEDSRRRREAQICRGHFSAARQLVQVGLFDRHRAGTASSPELGAATIAEDRPDSPLAAFLCVEVRLAAALKVTRR
jgi:superfamily II DNA or RNA helicase